MDDPIKIIWKYKNVNRRIQYNKYIFVGPVESDIMKILDKIKDLSLYETWIRLTENEYQQLDNHYGKKWYYKFFNSYHIQNIINIVRSTNSQQMELEGKYGATWYNDNINDIEELVGSKILYNYEAEFKDMESRRSSTRKREREEDIQINENINLDYRTKPNIQFGGQEIGEIDIDMNVDEDEDENPFDKGLNSEELLSTDEELDMQQIEELYKTLDVNVDNNVNKTSELIKKALEDDNIFEKQTSNMVSFDDSKNNTIYDENLKDVYKKHYVTTYYIFKDDSIKNIRNKICSSLKNNPIFGEESFIIPSRQYLWSEYNFNGKKEKIMIGQKWVKRNELLSIDIEPNNNLAYYEELRGNLKKLRDNMKRYGNHIRREDDDSNILNDYENFYSNNEIFMIDIYNELGRKYNMDSEKQRNLLDVYLKLYFPKIKTDDLTNIVDYLNGDTKIEQDRTSVIYETINNDQIMESEIMYMVENTKKNRDYEKVFRENYITQSVIHVNLHSETNPEDNRVDLYRIFNEFEVSVEYPFIQYQTQDGQITFKYHEEEINNYLKKKENISVLSKWFENAPYGISFKVKIVERDVDKFMAINLNENGRIEYKTQWKEDDMATIEDIVKTYNYVKNLVTEMNKYNIKNKFMIPQDIEFKYAFINTIQKFDLPEDFVINHNDLSDFSRYFYPYVALVIEPRKRQAKIQKDSSKSKFGTYLRFKRVSKYDNQQRIEQRIIYFMRNYEYEEKNLIKEISKQFNITEEKAEEEIEKIKKRYPNIKKSRKVLKKLENIPKYKPPGVGIDIQGKQRENYKIRISGARNKKQLDRIIIFMNILIYLYIETYLYKNPEKVYLKDKLRKLNNIAKRRNKVDEIVNYNKEVQTVKQMAQLDKRRIGFKPEKGQNQWTRACQNSGNDKRRRPQQFTSIDDLENKGYKFNSVTNEYERKVKVKGKNNSKEKEVVLRTIKLDDYDEEGNPTNNEIYYTCSPNDNGEHMFIGFLTKSVNPYGQCMPCCFKKDPLESKNKEKREFYMRCLGQIQNEEETEKDVVKPIGDRLYILQDTNKIQEGRFGFLPKYLNFFFNVSLEKKITVKQHYLTSTKSGYFFKYGSKQDEYPFLNSIGAILELTVEEIKDRLVKVLEDDVNDQIFTSLNNGNIKTQFRTKDKYIEFIKFNFNINFDTVNNLISIPGVLSENGLNIIAFQRKSIVIKRTFEKDEIKEDYVLLCQNNENIYDLINPLRETLFIINENNNFYPIVMVYKENEESRDVDVHKLFNYEDDKYNIVNHIKPFYQQNCFGNLLDDIVNNNSSLTAKITYHILNLVDNDKYLIKYQYVDVRNKCIYLITNNNVLIPVKPSGSLHNVNIINSIDKYVKSFDETYNSLMEIYNSVKKNHYLPIKPIGVYYDQYNNSTIRVIGIMTSTRSLAPIQTINMTIDEVKQMDLLYENRTSFDKIDKEIIKGKDNIVIDDRIMMVNYEKYQDESYQLFRMEVSEYLHINIQLKETIEAIINNGNMSKDIKYDKIQSLLYEIISDKLYTLYKQIGGSRNKFIHIIDEIPDISNYQVKNNRELCSKKMTKEECQNNIHCVWYQNKCYLGLTEEMVIRFISMITEELISGDMKSKEILRIGDYFVSDIVDYSKFKEVEGQRIVRSSNNTINKILNELFGKDNIPKIGRRRSSIKDVDYQQMNIDNPLRKMRNYYSQKVIENNLTIFRAYSNSFYWNNHPYFDVENRNLGYYNQIQTDLSIYFRSIIIDWLNKPYNIQIIQDEMIPYMEVKRESKNIIDDFILKIGSDVNIISNYIVELFILNMIQNIPILVYDENDEIMYVFDNGLIYHHKEDNEVPNIDKYDPSSIINLRFIYIIDDITPNNVEVLYFI